MIKQLLLSLFSFALLYGESIPLSQGQWSLLGTSAQGTLTSLGVTPDDIVWSYDAGSWFSNQESAKVTKLNALKAGQGFWILPSNDKTLQIPEQTQSEQHFEAGWSLYSPNQDLTVADSLNNSAVAIVWRYDGTEWYAWDSQGLYASHGFKKLQTLRVGQGAWVLVKSAFDTSLLKSPVVVGSKRTTLVNGNFTKVLKSSSQSIEDIWNISFEIKPQQNVSNFQVAIKFIKKSSGAYGEIVYSGLSIKNGAVSAPTAIDIKGTKSNGDSGGTYFDDSYDPHNVRAKSIAYANNRLTLKLGTIMASQTLMSPNTFTQVNEYNITIVPTKIAIEGGADKTLSNLAYLGQTYNGKGIVGDIKIH